MPSAVEESSPLTFDLKEELLVKMEKLRDALGLASNSEVVRHALAVFDASAFAAPEVLHRQISVRIPLSRKRELVRVARQKRVSLGVLLRAALEQLSVRPATGGASVQGKPDEPKMKKAAKKAPAKKAAKKAKKK